MEIKLIWYDDMIWYDWFYCHTSLILYCGRLDHGSQNWLMFGWMQGRKCIFVILQDKQFCAQISFIFHCLLASYFFNENENILSLGLYYGSKWVIFHELSLSEKKRKKNQFHPKYHSRPSCIHTTIHHDNLSLKITLKNYSYSENRYYKRNFFQCSFSVSALSLSDMMRKI